MLDTNWGMVAKSYHLQQLGSNGWDNSSAAQSLIPEALLMHRNGCSHSGNRKMCSQWHTAIHLFPTYTTL